MDKKVQLLLIFGVVCCNLLIMTTHTLAQPQVKIQEYSGKQILDLSVDRGKEIKILAHGKKLNLGFDWTLAGGGTLLGNTTGPGVFYVPPKVLNENPEKAVITVTVTDEEGEVATDEIIFTLNVQKLYTLRNDQLSTMARDCFEAQQYTTPEAMNAFDICKEILKRDSANAQAKEILHAIIDYYKLRGEKWEALVKKEQEQTNKTTLYKAIGYYERYLEVAEYIKGFDSSIKNEYRSIERRSNALKKRQQKLSEQR